VRVANEINSIWCEKFVLNNGFLVQDACVFARNFSELSYSHTKREGNKVAHNLAKLVVIFPNCVVWMVDVRFS